MEEKELNLRELFIQEIEVKNKMDEEFIQYRKRYWVEEILKDVIKSLVKYQDLKENFIQFDKHKDGKNIFDINLFNSLLDRLNNEFSEYKFKGDADVWDIGLYFGIKWKKIKKRKREIGMELENLENLEKNITFKRLDFVCRPYADTIYNYDVASIGCLDEEVKAYCKSIIHKCDKEDKDDRCLFENYFNFEKISKCEFNGKNVVFYKYSVIVPYLD